MQLSGDFRFFFAVVAEEPDAGELLKRANPNDGEDVCVELHGDGALPAALFEHVADEAEDGMLADGGVDAGPEVAKIFKDK